MKSFVGSREAIGRRARAQHHQPALGRVHSRQQAVGVLQVRRGEGHELVAWLRQPLQRAIHVLDDVVVAMHQQLPGLHGGPPRA
jgi:hypothetical protein